MKKSIRPLAAMPALLVLAWPAALPAQSIDPDSALTHIRYLASDALAGREAGDPGADSAAAYIARRLANFGLEALGTEGYLQPFEITTGIDVSPASRLVLSSAHGTRALELGVEWTPFSFSGAGWLDGPVRPAGHGLSDEDYESEAGHAAAAPIVLLDGGAPDDFNPHGAGGDASPRFKATKARGQGAEAVVIKVARLRPPRLGEAPNSIGIPAIQVLDRDDITEWLDSQDLTIELEAVVAPLRARAYNVAGRLEGRDPMLRDEIIVVGAHYDHLGLGGPGSLAPDEEAVHNGADDNASGTTLLLEIARYFAADPGRRPARSLVFVAFSAEEMGLLGSEHFVSHPPFPLDQVTAMLNFDMVGRLRNGRVQIFGTESAEEFEPVLDSLDAHSPLAFSYVGGGYGPSDQTSFYSRKIPVLHLFTGTHSEYHRPEDDWELINAEGLAQVGEFAIELIGTLGDWPGRFEVLERERPVAHGRGGYGPYLGTIPDFGEVEEGGVRLTGVRQGSPAEKAGLQGQDVVIKFGGAEVLNIYDYTYALRDHAPGDTVVIKVRRGGEIVDLTAVLGRRE